MDNADDDDMEKSGAILFVDDEESILRTLQRLFIPLGYDVFVASGGADGLEILEEEHIDVVISDMRMPEMNGAEFLKNVAERWPETKRVLLTGFAELDAAVSAVNDGKIHKYLNKPWKEGELEATVDELLESKRLRDKNNLLQEQVREQNEKLQEMNESLEEANKTLEEMNVSLEEKVRERTRALEDAYESIKENYDSSVKVLTNVVEMHEEENQKGHCRQVGETVERLGQKLNLNEDEVQTLKFAGLLHNLGKIGMSPELLKKPSMSLVGDDVKTYHQYPLLGQASLMAFEPLKEVSEIIVQHRERLNGEGYPAQLKADDILFPAKILSVVVDYCELQLGLLTEEKLLAPQALIFIKNSVDERYDATVVDAFEALLKETPDQRDRLNEIVVPPEGTRVGMVLSRDLLTNKGMLLLPAGQRLSQQHIDTINRLGDLTVYVKA